MEDDERELSLAEYLVIEAARDKREDLFRNIRTRVPGIAQMPFEAVLCFEFALKFVRDGKPTTVIPFHDGDISAIALLRRFSLEDLV